MSLLSLYIAFLFQLSRSGADVQLSADYSKGEAYPLQKAQFGVSYAGTSATQVENVYEWLKARHVRGHDKDLDPTWQGWDADGNPVYESRAWVLTPLENAIRHGAVDNANLMGPYEHPDRLTYRLGTHDENQWDWELYSEHSKQYYQHLRSEMESRGGAGYPLVFGIGHEPNNDADYENLGLTPDVCVDGIAFMGNLPYFRDVLRPGEDGRAAGDELQATVFFEWYTNTVAKLSFAAGGRKNLLLAAPQTHTSGYVGRAFLSTFHELVNAQSWIYKPDYIGCHARWNLRNQDHFFDWIISPSRGIFDDRPLWMCAPLMCNEFGVYDFDETYFGSMKAAVLLLDNFERMLECPDLGYSMFIYNDRFASTDGMQLYPAFLAFDFYQNMPQARTPLTGFLPEDMHVFASRSRHSVQAAMIWRDETGSGDTSVDLTFSNAHSSWTRAQASLYVIKSSSGDLDEKMPTDRNDGDHGRLACLVPGYPKTITGFEQLEHYTFKDIVLPPGSIALIKLERLDDGGHPLSDVELNRTGPSGAGLIRTYQWTARNGEGGVDSSWGYADTRNWTLFAGIAETNGSDGSVLAAYLEEPRSVKRGLAGIEFTNASSRLEFKVNVDTGVMNPSERDDHSIGAFRVDFYNGVTEQYDAATIVAGNRCPLISQYDEDYVPWGYGENNVSITPQNHLIGHVYNGNAVTLNLDAEYQNLTGKASADDFIAGGRRVIVSAWVENTVGGIRIRIGDAQ